MSECSVAVANALPLVKQRCDLVTAGACGAGVAELIDRVIGNDLADLDDRLTRHHVLLGYRADGQEEWISPYGTTVLVAGGSGAGKSTLAHHFTHHVPTATRALAPVAQELNGAVLVTVYPEHVAPPVLAGVDVALVVGESPAGTLVSFARSLGLQSPPAPDTAPAPDHALAWSRRGQDPPFALRSVPPRVERRRHRRKYAKGDLGAEHSFYFRGPRDKLLLRAANLMAFIELADGTDDETWEFHLRRGDYERWFRDTVKDGELAAEVARAADAGLTPAESRARIRTAVQQRYTAPA